ncbi:MADS-box transcription factor 23 [Cryptomeria japonica]|uniref:MADS-box transcription factor 23 n=1 Tax=Cryptomeria japonica TaxID=3369 RepID=UPI0027DA93DF|nr:MADS-box transcription factor 23 [Cryptomeria japonica]
MARERIEIRRIEKAAARQVTFCKRRRGLIKKAQELSILCEADVGLIIFSTSGKLFEYASSSMKMILEKFLESDKQPKLESTECENQDVRRMNQQIEDMKQSVRRMHGEDLQTLTLTELKQLEFKLEVGLKQIRAEKKEQLFKEAFDLEEKIAQLTEGNTKLDVQLNATHCCTSAQNSNEEETMFFELLDRQDHPKSSVSTICSAHNSSEHNESIKENGVPDTFLHLGLSTGYCLGGVG